jgi:hypothetical protein
MTGETFSTMTARDSGLDHDFITRLRPRHQIANFTDHACDVVAEDVWQRNLDPGQTITHPHVKMIQGTGSHLDQDFICLDLRIRNCGWP